MTKNELIAGGFQLYGAFHMTDSKLRIATKLPSKPGVYIFLVNEEVMYVGSTIVNVHGRMNCYLRSDRSWNVVDGIFNAINSGKKVELLINTQPTTTLNGLPLNVVVGLEQGLIDALSPKWNKRGCKATNSLPF
jgi:excinuclease UvrABC nuclease subunit